jgi:hypothetical protein
MNLAKTAFDTLEAFAFILPALPDNLWIRLLILLIYFIAHYIKLQYEYVKIKKLLFLSLNRIMKPKTWYIRTKRTILYNIRPIPTQEWSTFRIVANILQ